MRPDHSSRFYRPELDGLRFFAFCAVFLAHCSLSIALIRLLPKGALRDQLYALSQCSGHFGVSLFFCLSAYLITILLNRERQTFGNIAIGSFYARRILRIWPLYFLVLILFQLLRTPFSTPFPWETWLGFAFFLGNWALFFGGPLSSAAFILWSVSIEEQFYLIWPWIVRWGRNRFHLALLGLILLTWSSRWLIASFHPDLSRVYDTPLNASTFTYLEHFALGGWLASTTLPFLHPGRKCLLLAASAALFLLASHGMAAPASPLLVCSYSLSALACAGLLAASLDTGWLQWAPLVYLGRISYGLYVFHLPTLRTVEFFVFGGKYPNPQWFPTLETSLLATALAFLLNIAVASMVFEFYEKHFLKLKGRFTRVLSGPT